jgi:tRNA G46 methylase TrmB
MPSAAVDSVARSYDETPYLSQPFDFTHPSRMAALAALLGVDAPAVKTCRVLEIGCASGGNIIPMAVTLPEATFVGIDLSARQIAEGVQVVRELGLANIRLQPMDLRDAAAFGQFDPGVR